MTRTAHEQPSFIGIILFLLLKFFLNFCFEAIVISINKTTFNEKERDSNYDNYKKSLLIFCYLEKNDQMKMRRFEHILVSLFSLYVQYIRLRYFHIQSQKKVFKQPELSGIWIFFRNYLFEFKERFHILCIFFNFLYF